MLVWVARWQRNSDSKGSETVLTTFPDEEVIVRRLSQAWWPVAQVDEIERRPQEGHLATLLDRSLVVYRGESGKFYVADDRCPHRGASLALGCVSHDAIACPYHGWQWDGESGRCGRIPALGRDQSRIPASAQLKTYRAVTHWGLVWTCLDDDAGEELPDFPELEGQDWAMATCMHEQNTNLLFSMENFRDVAHFPFVHGNSFGGPPETPVEPLDVERRGDEVFLRRKMADVGAIPNPDLVPDGLKKTETMTLHAHAPGRVILYENAGTNVANGVIMHFPSPVSLERTRAFGVVLVSSELRHELDVFVRFNDLVYGEDAPVAASITPRRLGAPLDQVHTLADAYTLAFRKTFLEWLSPERARQGSASEQTMAGSA